jgi:tRNA-splicing ligase RtcB
MSHQLYYTLFILEMAVVFPKTQAGEQMKRLNVMVNAGGNVPIDESPNCYKPAKDVIDAVVKAGLARIAYTLTPIASLKGVD